MGLAAQKHGVRAESRKAISLAAPRTRQSLRERFASGKVEWSPDLERVLAIPRRDKPEILSTVIQALTLALKKPEGTQTLRELQAWVLHEMPRRGGGVAALHTGAGKTLIGMLMPMVWPAVKQDDGTYRAVRAVLLIPSDLRAQFATDWEMYGKHWKLPNLAGGRFFTPGLPTLHVVTYSELQQPKRSALLDQVKPDLLMGDELSALRNFQGSARARRVGRHMGNYYETALCGWDATLISDAVENVWHLFGWALGDGSPLPLEQRQVRAWGRAVDPEKYDDGYFLPGELSKLCAPGESVRSGLRRRLVHTEGFIASEDNQLSIPLVLRERRPPAMSEELLQHFKALRRKPSPAQEGWKRPDGELLRDMTEVIACAKQLAEGFYLYWAYPRGEPRELIEEWFLKRQNWNRELRAQLATPAVHMDSPHLCENAAERWYAGGCTGCSRGPQQQHADDCREWETHPLWESVTYLDWHAIENRVHHVTRVKWESEWLLQDAAAWAAEEPGIVWVDHPQFGHKLAQMTGLRFYGSGQNASEDLVHIDGKTSIIASINAHRKGKNLQAFNRNLIVSPPASSDAWEQTLGRTYREGQLAGHVSCDYYLHTQELENALRRAQDRAQFVQDTMGTAVKLCYAKYEGP